MCRLIMAANGRVLTSYFIASFLFGAPAFAQVYPSFTPHQKEDFWVSEGAGNYTLGFKDVNGDGAYLLSIWHSADPNHTAIWWANFGDDPVVKDGASFNLTNRGILQLYNANSMLVWNSSSDTSSSTVDFQDTGNLRLLNDNNDVVWQSFDDRRDSLMLVGLDNGMVENRPLLLQSRRNESSYAAGRFHVATDESLMLSLYGLDEWNNQFLYFIINMSTSDGVNIGQGYSEKSPVSDRLALDHDGNLRVYRWQSNVSSWGKAYWTLIRSTKCRLGSPCGPFGIYSSQEGDDPVSCSCPSGYHARVAADLTQGCVSNTSFNASCGGSSTASYNTAILEIPNATYFYNDMLPKGVYSRDLEQCKAMCLNNCACIAATSHVISNGAASLCFLKGNTTSGYLMNGYAPDSGHTLLLKVVSPIEGSHINSKGTGAKVAGSIVAATVVVTIFMGCAWYFLRHVATSSCWTRAGENKLGTDGISDARPVRFTYRELVKATKNFTHQLGKGGYGEVYKGWIRGKAAVDLQHSTSEQQQQQQSAVVVVAVKRMREDRASQGEKQFRAEVNTVGKIHHVNLVSLLGYCATNVGQAGEKWLLVYEYMENGSLDGFLSARRMQQALSWPIRYSVALGTARGIAYLHDGCSPRILHCDIKPQNVLLDRYFTAKVADFGLAKRFRQRESHLTKSEERGTRGFMAPEWQKSDEITPKVDVYSFGMLLLELVHGLNTGSDHMILMEWAVRCISEGVLLPDLHEFSVTAAADEFNDNMSRTVDTLTNNSSPGQQDDVNEQQDQEKLRLLKVALWCVQPMPARRPLMSCVVQQIDGTVAVESPPNPTSPPSGLQLPVRNIVSNSPVSFSILSGR